MTPVPVAKKPPVNVGKIVRRLIPFICLGVAGNLVFSFFTADRQSLGTLSGFSMGWLLAALVLALLPWGWHCLRLKIWTSFFGKNIAWKNLFRIAVMTDVGGAVTPTAVGGAPLKWMMLLQHGLKPGHATLLTLLGNVEDVLFYVLIIPLSLLLTDKWDHPLRERVGNVAGEHVWLAVGIAVALLVLWLILKKVFWKNAKTATWREKLRRTAGEFRDAWQLIRTSGGKPFLLSFLAMIGQWLTRFSILAALMKGLGLEVDYLEVYLLQWMVFTAILLVPTPGAVGGAEAAFLLVFGAMLPQGTATLVMAGWRLTTYYFILLVGVGLISWHGENGGSS